MDEHGGYQDANIVFLNPKFSIGFRYERLKYNLSRQGGKKISTFDEEA